MQKKQRVDSNLKVFFQTAAAVVSQLVTGDSSHGLQSASQLADRIKAKFQGPKK